MINLSSDTWLYDSVWRSKELVGVQSDLSDVRQVSLEYAFYLLCRLLNFDDYGS